MTHPVDIHWQRYLGFVWIVRSRDGSLERIDPRHLSTMAFDDPQFATSPPKTRTLIHLACLAAMGDAPPAFS